MSLVVLVLAAGEGTRMKSKTPKVLHEVLGRPLLGHVLNSVARINPAHTVVVTGAGRAAVEEFVRTAYPEVMTVEQAERLGTGHAVRIAIDDLAAKSMPFEEVMVLTADTPLLTADTLQSLIEQHRTSNSAATVLTAKLQDATGYGRILRAGDGRVQRIVEHRDASADELLINEINSGMYIFKGGPLRAALGEVGRNNAQGEEYLTDVLEILRNDGHSVDALAVADSNDILGINDRAQLASAAAILRERINLAWMRSGVTIVDPSTTWIESDVVIASDVTIEPNCYLRGKTAIANDAVIGPDTTLVDCIVDEAAKVIRSQASGAHIGPQVSVGPFTFLRPGAELHRQAKAGAYVEIKNSVIGAGSKVPHLSYVGDATIGTGTNIGAATVFVNYDGVNKHRTTVGDNVRIGSDTMLVAPVTVGNDAYTAAGSVITEDVPAGALGIGRARQTNILGWVAKRLGKTGK